jgi:hypothetical protein
MTAMRAPREVLPTATEAKKAAAFASPAVLAHDEAFSVGQTQTVDQVRETVRPWAMPTQILASVSH